MAQNVFKVSPMMSAIIIIVLLAIAIIIGIYTGDASKAGMPRAFTGRTTSILGYQVPTSDTIGQLKTFFG